MPRVTHCKICGKEIDEKTRYESIQQFDYAVCSMKCGLRAKEVEMMTLEDVMKGYNT